MPLKDFDSGVRAQLLQAKLWALGVSGTIGPVLGALLSDRFGVPLFVGIAVGIVSLFSFVYGVTVLVSGGTANMVGKVYHPSGASTPPRREYSRAEALAVQGHYEAAIDAYEVHVLEDPGDPEPYMRLARLFRDRLHRPADALQWFLKARRQALMSPGQVLFLIQEIVELYVHRLDEPRKAIPELAELCWRFPDSPATPRARRELEALRASIRADYDGEPQTGAPVADLGEIQEASPSV